MTDSQREQWFADRLSALALEELRALVGRA